MSEQPTTDGQRAAEVLQEAAALIREDPNRSASLLAFGSAGQLVMTGDMHGNLRNFAKLQRFCALERSPGRSVILHELIHEEPSPGQPDLSIDLLIKAAEWKCQFPDNVFFLQSNHELSQLCRHEITKGGRIVIEDFDHGVETRFGRLATVVMEGVRAYLDALPLAARTANGIFLSHSLPDPLSIETFDSTVFDRKPTMADCSPGGAAYSLVWGRFHTPEIVEHFARRLDADVFIVGHTPQETGHTVVGQLIILASDHNHGVFLPIDLGRTYSAAELASNVRKFVSVE